MSNARIVVDGPEALPDRPLCGRVLGVDDAAAVELVAIEETSGLIGADCVVDKVVVSTTTGPDGEFSLDVPATAIPGFDIEMIGRARSVRRWSLRVRAGSDQAAAAEQRIEVIPYPPDLGADEVPALPAGELERLVQRRRRSDLWSSGALMLLFSAIGLFALGVGLAYHFDPPDAWNGDNSDAVWAIGFGLAMLIFPIWWTLHKVRPLRVRGARIISVTSPVRRGSTIDVELEIRPGIEVKVGHVLQHYGTTDIGYVDRGQPLRSRRAAGWWDTLVYENWTTASADQRIVRLSVPEDIPPSYPGEVIINAHLIRVHALRNRSSRLSVRRMERQVVVIA